MKKKVKRKKLPVSVVSLKATVTRSAVLNKKAKQINALVDQRGFCTIQNTTIVCFLKKTKRYLMNKTF